MAFSSDKKIDSVLKDVFSSLNSCHIAMFGLSVINESEKYQKVFQKLRSGIFACMDSLYSLEHESDWEYL